MDRGAADGSGCLTGREGGERGERMGERRRETGREGEREGEREVVRRYGRRGEERREEKEGERRGHSMCSPLHYTSTLQHTYVLSSCPPLPYAARHIVLTVLTCHSSFSCSRVSYRSIFMSHSSCDTVGVCVCVHVEGREGWGKNASRQLWRRVCMRVCMCVCVCSQGARGGGGAGRGCGGRGENARGGARTRVT